jgi:hypothetical protein
MSNKRAEPTEEQLKEAHRSGVLLWKEIQDIEHIKNAVPDGCKCHLCEAARSVADTVSPEQTACAKNDTTPEFKPPSICPKCDEPFPFCIDNFHVIDALRCPNCDALFERGRFVCYGAKSEQAN